MNISKQQRGATTLEYGVTAAMLVVAFVTALGALGGAYQQILAQEEFRGSQHIVSQRAGVGTDTTLPTGGTCMSWNIIEQNCDPTSAELGKIDANVGP